MKKSLRWVWNFVLSEDTKFTLGAVAIIVSAILWLSQLSNSVQAVNKTVMEIQVDRAEYLQNVQAINQRLSTVEGYIKGMRDSKRLQDR